MSTGALVFGSYDHRIKWRVTSASSYEKGEGELQHIIDGSPDTFWHSRWSKDMPSYPHHIVIDFKDSLNLAGLKYLARQEQGNGRVKDYEIFLRDDGKKWGEAVKKGQFSGSTDWQEARFDQPRKARYMKLVALSEVSGQKFASIAELDVIEAK